MKKNGNIKRAAAGMMAACMIAGALAGCSGRKGSENKSDPAPSQTAGSEAAKTGESAGGQTAENTAEEPAHLKLFLTNKNIVDGSYAKQMI